MKKLRRIGQLCPVCGKGKLEKHKGCKAKNHKLELVCKTCHTTNF